MSRSHALIIDLDNGRELLPLPPSTSSTQSAEDDSSNTASEVIKEKAQKDRLHGPRVRLFLENKYSVVLSDIFWP